MNKLFEFNLYLNSDFFRVKPNRPAAGPHKPYLPTRQLHSHGMWSITVAAYASAATLSGGTLDEFRPFVVTIYPVFGTSDPRQHPPETGSGPERSTKQGQRWQSHGGSMCPTESCGHPLKHYSAMCSVMYVYVEVLYEVRGCNRLWAIIALLYDMLVWVAETFTFCIHRIVMFLNRMEILLGR